MTRFPALYHMLTGKLPETPAMAAEQARQALSERFEDAVRRKDTRAQHAAFEALKPLTNQALGMGSARANLSSASRSHTPRQAGAVRS